MTHAPTMSVVICCYTGERWDQLVTAIRSVQHQTYPAAGVVVVVDHNPDLLAKTRSHFPDTVVVENDQKRGLSGARNSGIAAAQGDVLVFFDDDAFAEPDWLEQLAAAYADPQVAGVGGEIEPIWAAGRPGWFPEEFNWVVGCTYRGMPRQTAEVRNLIGCNMSFRRAVFETIGGFQSGIGRVGKIPVGCEETELCIRLHQSAYPQKKLLYIPQARVYHQVPASRSTWRYFRSRCYQEGRSKALVSTLVGANDGLSSERTYTLVTLPQGVIRNLFKAVRYRNLDSAKRAGAIVLGLAITTFGYVRAALAMRLSKKQAVEHEAKPSYSKP
ncbi:MAG: glycosyltransferase family 2 protein [Anaerolineae bacterium]|nr:glycosyltransferase family 2 protein [Anaerolineae bacterium]